MESDDKKLYTPKYVQIEDHIISEIRNGRLKTGDRIPSEAELVRMFGVSRITVTTAIKELTARGILVRRQGKGTFVRRDDPGNFGRDGWFFGRAGWLRRFRIENDCFRRRDTACFTGKSGTETAHAPGEQDHLCGSRSMPEARS